MAPTANMTELLTLFMVAAPCDRTDWYTCTNLVAGFRGVEYQVCMAIESFIYFWFLTFERASTLQEELQRRAKARNSAVADGFREC